MHLADIAISVLLIYLRDFCDFSQFFSQLRKLGLRLIQRKAILGCLYVPFSVFGWYIKFA
jgi:hypothetical protein